MDKTKLGISAGLFGAALYLLGLVSTMSLVVAVGYVLMCEQDEWLRKTAVKSLGIVLFFTVLSTLLGFVGDGYSILTDFIGIISPYFSINFIVKLISIAKTLLSVAEAALFLLCAMKALKKEDLSLGAIDNIVNKYI